MGVIGRSLTGVFMAATAVALLGLAGRTVWLAVESRMADQPPAFAARERLPVVRVLTVSAGTETPELALFGEVRARRVLDLRAPAGGTAVWLSPAFIEGGRVAAGDVLLRLDPAEAEAALARATADLTDAEAAARDADRALPIARDVLAGAVAQAALRARALQRQRDLQARGVGTAPDLEAAELAAAAADQAVLSAREGAAQAEARIDQAATAVARARLTVEEARRALEDTVLTAPFDGVLTGVTLVQGARVGAGEALGQLLDPGALDVAIRVSTAQYARLIDAQGGLIAAPVTIALGSDAADLTATGRLEREATGDALAGRLVFAALDPGSALRPGDFVTVTLREPPLDGVARLPASAVGADGAVLVLDAEDRLRAQPVTVLRRSGDAVIVAAATLDGARIVAERSPLIGAGLRVRPAGDPAAAAPAQMIDLTEERRARLVALVTENSRMPDEVKSAILAQLEQRQVPADVVARIESRAGG